MNLWPTIAPCSLGNASEDTPEITVYPLKDAERPAPAIVVCPGGGYACLCDSYEGHDIANWLNGFGFADFRAGH